MDHNEAVRLQAVEKYLLRELPPAQLEEYEEHYFDCPACAEDLKTAVAFMESTRQVFREEVTQTANSKRLVPSTGGWFGWLRPAFAVPVFAALLLFIGYQNGVTIPKLKNSSYSSMTAQPISSSFQLRGGARGASETGEPTNKVRVRSGEGFTLNFDFTPKGTFAQYDWHLLDPSGRTIRSGQIDGDKENQTVSMTLSGGVKNSGKYSLVFYGASGNAPSANQTEAQRITFTVEFPQ